MSEAEALAGLRVACNIFQVISFSKEVIELFHAFYENRNPDPSITVTTSDLTKAIDDLCNSLNQKQTSNAGNDNEIVLIKKDCISFAR